MGIVLLVLGVVLLIFWVFGLVLDLIGTLIWIFLVAGIVLVLIALLRGVIGGRGA